MQLEFGYGSGVQTVELPQENLLGVLHAAPIEHERRGPDAVSWALAHPIGSAPLHPLARPGQRIAIVTSDITRPLPSYQILPGVSTPLAIQANHRLMVSPLSCAGRLDGNPVREDLEEAAAICGVDFTVNVVLDEHKQIVYAVAGDVTRAHRAGCAYLDRMYRCPIPEKADIVLVSQGGAPKDANLYQTQKALDNAKHAVKDGGTTILIDACPEGLGSKTLHCRICRTQAPITAGHNKLKSSRSQMRPAAFSDNMQVQAQMLRPM